MEGQPSHRGQRYKEHGNVANSITEGRGRWGSLKRQLGVRSLNGVEELFERPSTGNLELIFQ